MPTCFPSRGASARAPRGRTGIDSPGLPHGRKFRVGARGDTPGTARGTERDRERRTRRTSAPGRRRQRIQLQRKVAPSQRVAGRSDSSYKGVPGAAGARAPPPREPPAASSATARPARGCTESGNLSSFLGGQSQRSRRHLEGVLISVRVTMT